MMVNEWLDPILSLNEAARTELRHNAQPQFGSPILYEE